jgi:hypothetical protein
MFLPKKELIQVIWDDLSNGDLVYEWGCNRWYGPFIVKEVDNCEFINPYNKMRITVIHLKGRFFKREDIYG